MRRRPPVIEHTEDPELGSVEAQGAADRVGVAEQLLVELLRDHHDSRRSRVLGGGWIESNP